MGGVHPWHPPSRIDNGFKSVRDLSMVSKLLAIIRNSTSKLTLYQHEMVIEEQPPTSATDMQHYGLTMSLE